MSGNGEWRREPSTDPAEGKSVSPPNEQTTSPSSDTTSPRDRSKRSCSSRSLSENSSSSSETPESVNETPETPKNKMRQTLPKVAYTGFSWRKSPPWKRSTLKLQHPPIAIRHAERDITRRILSAQVRNIKVLKDELCEVQRSLGDVKCQNRLLTRLQRRHMKALQKYEGSEGSVHHLITQHSNEVGALRENLRAAQRSERGLSLRLKTAEGELLKTKDNLLRLQRLAEDKNLKEREELSKKLSRLSVKMELQSSKEKVALTGTPEDHPDIRRHGKWEAGSTYNLQCNYVWAAGIYSATENSGLQHLYIHGIETFGARSSSHFLLLCLQVLEKQLHLTTRFYNRQLALESKKTSEARGTARRLQDQILLLQQTVKKKERELHIKNIYAHRIPRDIWKYGSREGQGGMTFTKSIQTESEMFTPDQPDAHRGQECGEPQDKTTEPENDSTEEEDDDAQMTGAEAPIHEVLQTEESDGSLEIDGKYNEEDKESSSEEPDQQGSGEHPPLEDTRYCEKNQPDDSWNETKADSGRRVGSGDARRFLPRRNRHYTFTAATENLHQGLPATGPILTLRKAYNCKSLMLQRSSSLGHEELSLQKIETGSHNKKEKLPEVFQSKRKKKLMEELFGPGYDEKNRISSDFLTSEFSL
ncbi:lebercilin-like protein [Eleutherodactylus coqui]|uniref:lebercilin-like protein n=1 Tax=Eleutherodactylus coqui TaxID=57060 RepID=UPI003462A7FE